MGAPTYTSILNPILDTWVTFVVLVLIFVIGSRKRDVDSLWATELPETAVFGEWFHQKAQLSVLTSRWLVVGFRVVSVRRLGV